ncbi:DNA repair protein RAD1 [Spathaspora sp. JA1]|nr:DNA repair protein RAD1 [Spathaspora sp. JA1]
MSLFVEDDQQPEETRLIPDVDPGSIPVVFQEPEIIPIYPDREVNCTLPLPYQQVIVEDMLTKDGLLILGHGLGWDLITSNLLHALSSPTVTLANNQVSKRGLIFVLNMRKEEIVQLREELSYLSWLDDNNTPKIPFMEITGDSQSGKRKSIYSEGGIISITSRVLVVDLLSGMISPNDITGLFILHAERIRETSNESFIVSLFRDQNEWGFIKAFSDNPEAFATGFTPLATKLKVLRLSNVFLWPRFHVTISQSFNILKKQQQDLRKYVTEINTKLSYKMNKIQSAILSCIQACLGELKRHNSELATEYWDMENVHDPDFVRNIRLSLESQWHRVTYTTKILVTDLSTLLNLLNGLLTLDSVAYYQVVQEIVDANIKHQASSINASMSPWLNLNESNTIISYAKERALGKYNDEYILEELPKWDQLGSLIDDILYEKSTSSMKDQGPILIMCSSRRIAKQLCKLIETMKLEQVADKKRFSARKYMIRKVHEYLAWKEVNSLVKKVNSELNKEQKQPQEGETESTAEEISVSKTFTRNGQPISKRRRTRGDSVTARVSKMYSSTNSDVVDVDEDELKKLEEDEEQKDDEGEIQYSEDELEEVEEMVSHLEFAHITNDTQILIQAYNEDNDISLLQELSPSHIIMYEPNLTFIRRIEIFQAINHDTPAKVFFMYYGNSIEEQKHLIRIKKEKEAFTKLIKEKASLGKHFETAQDNSRFQIQRNQVVNTRIAGGSQFRTEADEMRVVVDVREFRSSLPNLLYRIGIKVVPCMITVGDYIVSPKICVERKSIPDLISSFKSGRLYHQCEQMFKHYELPTLLIEFDENKSFSLEPFSETKFQRAGAPRNPTVSNKIQQNIQSKLVSLVMAFPKLKIIWSSSPYETAQIFLELKSNQAEPEVSAAMDKGVNRSVVTEDGGPPIFNDDPIDFIQNIPGINAINYHILIQKVRNIEQLVQLSKQEFMSILGEENGRKAYNFINRKLS